MLEISECMFSKHKLLVAICAAAAVLLGANVKTFAQSTIYNFDTSLGSGTLNLNTNNITPYGGDITTSAAYVDLVDTLTFNGTNYSNLNFGIINNTLFSTPPGTSQDAFWVQGGYNDGTHSTSIELEIIGNVNTVNGATISDLIAAMSRFSTLTSDPFSRTIATYLPDAPTANGKLSGTISAFDIQAVPEPSTLALAALSIGVLAFGQSNRKV